MSDPRQWVGEDWYKATEGLSEADMSAFAHSIEQVCDEADQGNWNNVVGDGIQADFSSLESDIDVE